MVIVRKRSGANGMTNPAREDNSLAYKTEPSSQENAFPMDADLHATFTDMCAEWQRYTLFGISTSRKRAEQKARELEAQIQRKVGPHPSTVPLGIGVGTSKESGFVALTPDTVSEMLEKAPTLDLFGYINLQHESAEHAARAYQHMHELAVVANRRIADTKYPNLDVIVRNPIHTPAAVAGPLQLTKNRYALFLEWVIGPLVHEQLDPSFPRGNITEEQRSQLNHQTMLATAHLIGTWQANPFPQDMNRPADLDAIVRAHYIDSGVNSVRTLAEVTRIDISEEELAMVEKYFSNVIGANSFRLNPDPLTGNIAVYGDWNIRNLVQRLKSRKPKPTAADVFSNVVDHGEINFSKLLEFLTKLDLNNPEIRWVVDADETAHLVRNLHAPQDPTLVQLYTGASVLVRQAFRYFLYNERNNAGRYSRELAQARDFAEAYDSIRTGAPSPSDVRIAPMNIPLLKRYFSEFESTITTVHFLRVLRQAALAAGQYLPRVYALSQMSNAVDTPAIDKVALEVEDYMKRAADQHDAVVATSGITSRSERYESARVAKDVLDRLHSALAERDYNDVKLVERGMNSLAGFSQ